MATPQTMKSSVSWGASLAVHHLTGEGRSVASTSQAGAQGMCTIIASDEPAKILIVEVLETIYIFPSQNSCISNFCLLEANGKCKMKRLLVTLEYVF